MPIARIPPRFELKYVVPLSEIDRVRAALGATCSLDPHSAAADRQRYCIGSLYLDGPDLPFHRAKSNRAQRRQKLRVRHYPSSPEAGCFLEIKRRIGDVIVKRRHHLPPGIDWSDRLRGEDAEVHPIEEDFRALMMLYDASPTVYVRYEREAWVSDVDEYGRVTFDSALEFAPHDAWNLDFDEKEFRSMDDAAKLGVLGSWVIIELKFAERLPTWMEALGRRFDLFRRGFSKYCSAIDRLYVDDLRLQPGIRVSTLTG